MSTLKVKQHTERNRGFTLVETLVAIVILILAIVGPMTIASRGLQSTFFAKDQITALYLAQEGVEVIRALRDQNALVNVRGGSNDWLEGLDGACSTADGCSYDIRNSADPWGSCATIANCQLLYDSGSLSNNRGFYTYVSGGGTTLSPYTRVIFVNETINDQEAEVTVVVSWQSTLFGGVKDVTVQSRVLNQYDNL